MPITFPLLSLDAEIEVSFASKMQVNVSFPKLTASLTMLNNAIVCDVDISLPVFLINSYTAPFASISLPALGISATAITNVPGNADISIPRIAINASAYAAITCEASITIPILRIGSPVQQEINVAYSKSLPLFKIDAAATLGILASVNIELPLINADAGCYTAHQADVQLPIPVIIIQGHIISVRTALCLNTDNYSLSSYPVYDFDSLATLNKTGIGFSKTGIYELSGADDAGALIDWKIKSGRIDLARGRLRQLWITGKFPSNITLTVENDHGETFEYIGEPVCANESELRIKTGKGIRSRYVIIELSGSDSQEVTIDSLRMFGATNLRTR